MIELPFISMDLVRGVVQNFTIIATLVLLYHFIPDSLQKRSKLAFSLSVGGIFGIAAVISIPAFWQAAGGPALGFNIVLVPLAGFIGGPVSAVIVAAMILLGSTVSGGFLSSNDVLTVVIGGIFLGTLFYACRSWKRFPSSYIVQLLLLGTGVALIEICSFAFSLILQASPGHLSGVSPIVSIFPYVIISIGGTVILGSIIGYIDRKKQAEMELLEYKIHLQGLVKERTAELRKANSLQKATIESTADGIVVVDRDGVIRAYNQKASHILDLPKHQPIDTEDYGAFIDKTVAFLSDPAGFLRLVSSLPDSAEDVVMTDLKFNNGRIYELYEHPQLIGDRNIGRVWSFHDVTVQRQNEEAIVAAHNKLLLLSDITRHDIFNQLAALSVYLDMLDAANCGPGASGYIKSMNTSLEIIGDQLEFTRDYQDLGLKKPEWRDVGTAFTKAAESFNGRDVAFSCETGPVEIFADPMIGQAFYNLIDNSLRHGEHVSEIRLSVGKKDPDLLLIYQDNGTGVPPEEKEKIFIKGFGKHTGLGMFLISEILSITNLTIRETGVYLQGARFEIHVPPGKFRFP